MRPFVLSLLLGTITASPVDYQPSSLYNDRQRALETGAFVGWYDPRILGGRFLDVRHGEVFRVKFALINHTVHHQNQGGTSECHHFWLIRFLHPYRRGLSRLCKVSWLPNNIFQFNLLFIRSLGYSGECLGLHYGNIHEADLGDGDRRKPEMFLARQSYFPILGTCWESVAGWHLTLPPPSEL